MTQSNEFLPGQMRYSLESHLRAVRMVVERADARARWCAAWGWGEPRSTARCSAIGRRAWTVCATTPRARIINRAS